VSLRVPLLSLDVSGPATVPVAVRELSRCGLVVVDSTEAVSSHYPLAFLRAFTPDNAAALVARMPRGDVTKKRATRNAATLFFLAESCLHRRFCDVSGSEGEGAHQVDYCLCSGCVTEELSLGTCDLYRHEQTAAIVCLDGMPSSLASILLLSCVRTSFCVLGFVLVLEAVWSTPGLLFGMHIYLDSCSRA